MAECSTTVWVVFFSLIFVRVIPEAVSPEKRLGLTTFDCQLHIKDVKWAMECESENFLIDSSSKFFFVNLFGTVGPITPLQYDTLLTSTSRSEFEFRLCDSQWRYFARLNLPTMLAHCVNYGKLPKHLMNVFNQSSLRTIEISHTPNIELMLNILQGSSHLKHVTVRDNVLSNFSFIPVYPNNSVLSLNLERNQIENVTNGLFCNFTKLQLLDLSENLLKYVHKALFGGLTAVSHLDMSFNAIEYMSEDALSNFLALESIYLMNNNLKHINGDLFKFNSLLYEININNNNLKRLPLTLFRNLPNLRNVSCSNCRLLELNEELFEKCPIITKMNFSCNYFKGLPEDIFKKLTYLANLDLSQNNLSYISENIFKNQHNLRILNMSRNEIQHIPKGLFVEAININILDMSYNKIQVLSDDHVKRFNYLEGFSLKHNKLTSVELGLGIPNKIRILNLSNNLITKFNVGWKQMIYLETLNVDHNLLTSVELPPCIPRIQQTLTFTFKFNNISRINIESLISDETRVKTEEKSMAACFFNGLAKNYVDLTHNPLLCDCNLYPFYNYVKKKSPRKYQLEIFLNKEKITCGDPPALKDASLISFADDTLSCPLADKCPSLCSCGIRGKDNLTFVNCSSNRLKEVPSIIPDETSVLYFNDNQLKSMISLNNEVWGNLSELHLDHNLLTKLDDWNIPVSLRYLSVRGNKLKRLPSSLMRYISEQSKFQLYFGNNDQNCDCDRKELKKFLVQNIRFVVDDEKILCIVTNNGTSAFLPLTSTPDRELCHLNYIAQINYRKKLAISLCVCFIFSITLLLFYYKKRQLILSFLYIHCDYLFHWCFSEDDPDDDHIFDAFVSYSSTDHDMVMKLMEELETKPPFFKLCIHERNWLPGRFITENIIDSVHCSRRTIVILSNAFTASPWFNLELRAAVFKMLKDKMSRIIVILAENSVLLDNIDSEVKHVISKRTYLVWGERWFWEKLRYAMPRKKNPEGVKESRRAQLLPVKTTSQVSLILEDT